MSSFGPSPIPINPPGAVQSSFIAQHAQAPKAREKTKPQDSDPPRRIVRDEVQIHGPGHADPVDPKPDAAEEWKYRRPHTPHRDPRLPGAPRAEGDGEGGRLDIQA